MIRLGVVGLGRIGSLRAEMIASGRIEGAELSTVVDPDDDALAAFCGRSAAVSGSFSDMLDGSDAVLICSPSDRHAVAVESLADIGVPVFVEKPAGVSIDECERLAARSNAVIQVGFNRRSDPRVRSFARHVESLPILSLRIVSRDMTPPPAEYLAASGSIFVDMTVHDFDLALWLAGPVVSVYATGDEFVSWTTLTHETGAVTTVESSRWSADGYDQRLEALTPVGTFSTGVAVTASACMSSLTVAG